MVDSNRHTLLETVSNFFSSPVSSNVSWSSRESFLVAEPVALNYFYPLIAVSILHPEQHPSSYVPSCVDVFPLPSFIFGLAESFLLYKISSLRTTFRLANVDMVVA